MNRILYIRPVANGPRAHDMNIALQAAAAPETTVELVSLAKQQPRHLEFHAYEALALGEIVQRVRAATATHAAIILGGFYDMGLRAAREISGSAFVTAPCESATSIAGQLGNSFSILVGRRKWTPRVSDNLLRYGRLNACASIRDIDLWVDDIHTHDETLDRFITAGRACIDEDGAEVIILGCTADYGFHEKLRDELGVPVIDSMLAALKMAEMLVAGGKAFGWQPSRVHGSGAPPESEIEAWGIFDRLANDKERT
ncbi:MAG: aspartate/glutamate racemase family protein [Acidobacteriota bacterium]|nr:aspartate/glutamate racemase family protein [Acidobacteriota bacterium]